MYLKCTKKNKKKEQKFNDYQKSPSDNFTK